MEAKRIDYDSPVNQDIKRKFVEREVIHCASMLVYELAQKAEHFPDYEDDLYGAFEGLPDYEEAARAEGWNEFDGNFMPKWLKDEMEIMKEKSPKKCTVCFEPSGLKTELSQGKTLLKAARKAGVYLSSICGGDGYCGKCKLIIDEGDFQSRPTALLTQDEIRSNVVLACQTKILSDMTVTVPKSHALDAGQILMDTDTQRFSALAGDIKEGIFQHLCDFRYRGYISHITD